MTRSTKRRMRKASDSRVKAVRDEPRGSNAPSSETSGSETHEQHVGGLIVGIGASAGGLNAFKGFFARMPVDSGMAFVLVQHLSPDHKSMLTEILGKMTAMPVVEAKDGMPVDAGRVFVIPPDATLTLKDRRLQVLKPAPPRDRRRPIDTFFSSLAEDQGDNAVCIVLAGTGSDGTLGLKTIKENGGLTLAQAEFDHTAMSGMPHSASATGLVDHVLPVEEMPAKLIEYRDHLLLVADRKDGDGTRNDAAEHLATISALLRARMGHDFSKYKAKTMTRRIQRRMQVLQADTVPAYIARLREDRREIELLFRELLIGVTQFFREPDSFEALRTSAIAKLLERRRSDDPIRVWVPACSTGEEAYSIAIVLREAMEHEGIASNVQIFATDIDDQAVAFARTGRYRKTVGISPERLGRWFAENDDDFCPIRQIREMCVFSEHNVIKDPPFSKLDLISCRNLLIYMNSDLQDRVLRTFHYALNPDATLFLGPSEGVSRHGNLFAPLDKKYHIFRRRDADAAFPGLPTATTALHPVGHLPSAATNPPGNDRIDRSARRALLKYSPVYLVIDKHHNILSFSGGEAGRYLEPSAGPASLKLFGNLRKTLRPIVRTALQVALDTTEAVVHDDIAIEIDGKSRSLTVIVEPISDESEAGLCVVAFQEARTVKNGIDAIAPSEIETAKIRAAEHELRTMRAQLQSTVDDLETANEEMRSANEEYQSVNEELQSSNEELETSKEEMQSINEELQTVNAELSSKNDLLMHLNSDLQNLLDSTQIATIFLDNNLRIKSFTPGMVGIFHLRAGDLGRPITEIVSLLVYEDLRRDVTKVLRDLTVVERELRLQEAKATYIMRIRPYRTVENVIDGVVMTFVDISERKKADLALQASEVRFSAIVNQATVGVAEIDLKGGFVLTNARFCDIVGRSDRDLLSLRMQDITHPDDLQRDTLLFDRLLSDGTPFEIEMRYLRPNGTVAWVHNSVSALIDQSGQPDHCLAVALEIGERKRTEEQKSLLLAELDHRVKNILAVVSSVATQTLKTNSTPAVLAAAIEGRIAAIARAHDMLTNGGGRGGATLRDLVATELDPYNREGRNISVDGVDIPLTPRAALSLAMAIHELASNAAKFGALSVSAGRLTVSWTLARAPSPMLNFVWVETGGPPIVKPPQRGFGTTLIERTLAHEFDAMVSQEFLSAGLRCTISLPLTAEFGEVRFSEAREGKAR
jgi:two-component system, chemotaxis family, CheB/CheR fusion protein